MVGRLRGTIHWISAAHAIDAEVRLYDVMFENEDPSDVPEGKDWKDLINPNALVVMQNAKVEPLLNDANAGDSFQFVRNGYFCIDSKDSQPGKTRVESDSDAERCLVKTAEKRWLTQMILGALGH